MLAIRDPEIDGRTRRYRQGVGRFVLLGLLVRIQKDNVVNAVIFARDRDRLGERGNRGEALKTLQSSNQPVEMEIEVASRANLGRLPEGEVLKPDRQLFLRGHRSALH